MQIFEIIELLVGFHDDGLFLFIRRKFGNICEADMDMVIGSVFFADVKRMTHASSHEQQMKEVFAFLELLWRRSEGVGQSTLENSTVADLRARRHFWAV
jgi:hypothetical protein